MYRKSKYHAAMHYTFNILMEKVSRMQTMTLKKVKRPFKNKENYDPFSRTVKISCRSPQKYFECKMRLDTGCDVHNLISREIVEMLELSDVVTINREVICICLNGDKLASCGTIVLRWKGKRFRKIFHTEFHVVDGEYLPWDVILGAKTIQEHGILEFAGFGGRSLPVFPKKDKDMKEEESSRRQEYDRARMLHGRKVDADIKAKEDAARIWRSATTTSTSSSSGSSRQ